MSPDEVTRWWQKSALQQICPQRDTDIPEGEAFEVILSRKEPVAEFGCGRGRLRRLFGDYVGYDISAPAINAARRQYPDTEFHLIEPGEVIPHHGTVIAHAVFQHIPDLRRAMAQIRHCDRLVISENMGSRPGKKNPPPTFRRKPADFLSELPEHRLVDMVSIPDLSYRREFITVLTCDRL